MRREEGFFVTAFIIRKLADSGRLSFQAERVRIPCITHSLLDRARLPDWLNWERIDEFYDFDQQEAITIPLRRLANTIIHSYVLLFATDAEESVAETGAGSVTGFYVNSDHSRERLYFVNWSDYEEAVSFIASDRIVASTGFRDGKGREVYFNSRMHIRDIDWQEIERLEPGYAKKFRKQRDDILRERGIRPPLSNISDLSSRDEG
jgi:hypothetical protein